MPLDAPVIRMFLPDIARVFGFAWSEYQETLGCGIAGRQLTGPSCRSRPWESRVNVVEVKTRRHWSDFHLLPHAVYRDDSQWVAPLLLERKLHFTPKHNPYFEHARATFFLVYADSKPVGRISAQVDELHLARYRDSTGHFGFIEAIDDSKVFGALIGAAENW